MKIALLCPRYLWAGGGSVLFTRRVAEELITRGHATTLFADAPESPAGGGPADFHGGPVKQMPRDRSREKRAARFLSLERLRGGYRLGKILFRSGRLRLLAAGPVCPDLDDPAFFRDFDAIVLVNAHSAWTAQLARTLARLPGKLRVTVPLFHPHEEGSSFSVMARLHRQVDLVCGLTEYEQKVMARPGWPQTAFRVVGAGSDPYPAPVDPQAFRERHGIPPDAPLVLFLGRKIYNKGVTHVIEAMRQIWSARPDARLALLGFQHNDEAWLRRHLGDNPLSAGRVVNRDDVSHQEREEALAACTLLAVPSISDSFGIVYLDAWRYGKPVIACRDTCAETFVRDGENGLLVPFEAPAACAAAIGRLLDRPAEAAAMGEAGRRLWAEQFRWSQVAGRLETALLEAGK